MKAQAQLTAIVFTVLIVGLVATTFLSNNGFRFEGLVDITGMAPATSTSCGDITTPGTLTLTSNVSVSSGDCFNITASNVVLDCNGHLINCTGNCNNGIFVNNASNVTIRNCNIKNYNNGVYVFFGNLIIYNNNITNSTVGIRTSGSPYESKYSYINASKNTINATATDMDLAVLSGSQIYENNIYGAQRGIWVSAFSNYNNIFNNTIKNNTYGIQNAPEFASTNNILDSNTFLQNTKDIHANTSGTLTLIIRRGDNSIKYDSKVINITDIDNLFVNDSIAAVNSSAEPQMNTSANITLQVSTCPSYIVYRDGFWRNISDINGYGSLCDETNYCHNINCTDNILTFNVDRFSSYAAVPCVMPTDGMNITSSVTFCSGTYDLPNGVTVGASNITITCNNTIFNGTGLYNGITLNQKNNVTINGCTFTKYGNGIYLYSSSSNTLTNNTANNNNHGIYLSYSSSNTLTNNTANNNSWGIYLYSSSSNTLTNNIANYNNYGISLSSSSSNTLTNNTANNNYYGHGISLSYSSNNTLTNNTANNNYYGIYLFSSSNNTLNNNILANNSEKDIYTYDSSSTNTLNITYGANNLLFSNKIINVTNISNIYINDSIVSVNSSAEPNMNTSANITLQVSTCPSYIVYRDGFWRNISDINGYGSLCDETNYCHNINCTDNILTFNVDRFSSYAAVPCVMPTNRMDITSDVTFCSGTYNLPNGVTVGASNITITCNNTIFNGTGLYNGITLNQKNNVTINGCTFLRYNNGIYLLSSSNNTLTENIIQYSAGNGIYLNYSSNNIMANNKVNNNFNNGVYLLDSSNYNTITNNTANNNWWYGIYLSSSSNNTLTNNTANDNNWGGIYLYAFSKNNALTNNTANNNQNGILLSYSSSNTLTNNTANNNDYGIYLYYYSSNNTLTNNILANNSQKDIYTFDSSTNTLKVISGMNSLVFYNKLINVTDIDNLYITDSLAAVNTVAEPQMNTSANISFVVPRCDIDLYKSYGFYKSLDIVRYDAVPCDTCSGYVCADNIANFSVSEFSTVFANVIPVITDVYPNATGQYQPIEMNETNITTNATLRENITFNATVEDVDSDILTFKWFVNAILAFWEDVTNFFGRVFSIFTFNFTTGGMHNVTLVVSDALGSNDTFEFKVNISCANDDADGDGYYKTEGCGILDCNDNNASIRPPTDNETLNSDVSYCAGTYYMPSGIRINKSNVVVTCDNTTFVGESQITSARAIYVNNLENVTIVGCKAMNYNRGFHFQSVSDSTFMNNIAVNNTYGFYLHYNSGGNRLFNNTFENNTQYGFYVFNNATGNDLSNNTFKNNYRSIWSDATSNNTLSVWKGMNRVTFDSKNINFINLTNIFINDSIVALDASLEPGMNVSANITFNVSRCPQDIYYNDSFMTDKDAVIAQKNICPNNICHNITCSNNVLNFVVNHFSTYAANASACVEPEDGMNITSSITFCSGTYNLPNGINVNASDIVITCNNTIFNGTGSNNGVTLNEKNNVTISSCTFGRYQYGISLYQSYSNLIVNNIVINNSEHGIFSINSSNILINNTIINNMHGVSLGYSYYNVVTNNTIANNSIHGISLDYSPNNILTDNILNNNQIGIYLVLSTSNTITNNIFTNNSQDISTPDSSTNTLNITYGANNLLFSNKIINVTKINNIYLNNSIVSINSSAEPAMNVSANITFNVSSCPAPIYFKDGFFTVREDVIFGGSICDETNYCHNINCTDNILTFNVDRFSSYAAGCIEPTDGMNINSSVQLCEGTFNLPNGINITGVNTEVYCLGTVLNGTGDNPGINIDGLSRDADGIMLKGCHIQNYYEGIKIYHSDNITIDSNYIANNSHGILILMSFNDIIINNTVANNSFNGISGGNGMFSGFNANIINNTLFGNGENGISGIGSNKLISGNNISNNLGSGINIVTYSSNVTISSNIIFNNNVSGIISSSGSNHRINDNVINNNTYGVYFSFTQAEIFNNSFINNINSDISLYTSSNDNKIFNNTFSSGTYGVNIYQASGNNISNNLFINENYALLQGQASGTNFNNNTVVNMSAYGVYLDMGGMNIYNNLFANESYAISVGASASSLIFNNSFINHVKPIALFSSLTTILDNVYINSSVQDIFSYVGKNNTLILSAGSNNKLAFNNKFINITDIKNIYLNDSIVAVNSSAEPAMNISASVSLYVPTCNATLMEADGFYKSISEIASAIPCTTCHNISCENNIMNFTTNHFSTIFAYVTPKFTSIYPNATNKTQPIVNETNVTFTTEVGTNITFNVSGQGGANPFTLTWFVNGIAKAWEIVSGFFTSIFSWLFNETGEYNITVKVNDSLVSNEFMFNVTSVCVDNDGDGFNRSGYDCGPIDCNDDDSNIIPPVDGMSINRSITLCGGIYNLPNGVNVNASDIVITCNNTIFNGTGSNYGITLNERNNVTLSRCTFSRYEMGIRLYSSSNNTIIDNIVNNNVWNGIYLDSSSNNTITNNTANNNLNGIHLFSSLNNTLINNTINQNFQYGIFLQYYADYNILNSNKVGNNIGYGIHLYLSSDNTFTNNIIYNNTQNGIYLDDSSYNNTLTNNIFANNLMSDISTGGASTNTLKITLGLNSLIFYNKLISVIDIDNLFINNSIVAVNVTAEPEMNIPAEITFAKLNHPTTPTIYRYENFTTNRTLALALGTVCNETNYCKDITYSSGILKFNVTGFSTYAIADYSPPYQPPSGGGGGGGITREREETPSYGPIYICFEDWTCTDWSECTEQGVRTRICTDKANCKTTYKKPAETESCVYVAPAPPTPPTPPVVEVPTPQPEKTWWQKLLEIIQKNINAVIYGAITGIIILVLLISTIIAISRHAKIKPTTGIELKPETAKPEAIDRRKEAYLKLKELEKYILHALANGFKKEEIKSKLLNKGWPEHVIDEIMKKL